jgi:thioredoxin-dependent peroxiredoxin
MARARGWLAGLAAASGLLVHGATVKPGMRAPEFEAKDQDGRTVRLADFAGRSCVVLYFYPKDDTPGCTQEACSLRDGHQAILDAGAVVLGVSADDVGSHAAFAAKYRLPFPILADPDGRLMAAYGVKWPLLTLAHRVTFIIDRQGIVRHRVERVDTARHDRQVLERLKGL